MLATDNAGRFSANPKHWTSRIAGRPGRPRSSSPRAARNFRLERLKLDQLEAGEPSFGDQSGYDEGVDVVGWIVAGASCLVVLVVAAVAVIRLLALASDAEPLESESTDDDAESWAWSREDSARR
jgi:hypothetical protein